MVGYREELGRIKSQLKAHPRGLTITEIARLIGINRNSTAKYLDVLVTSGEVEHKEIGPAKVFFLTKKVPLTAMLNLANESILILDGTLSIAYANDNFLKLCGLERKQIIGNKIGDLECPGLDDSEIMDHLRFPPEAGEFFKEIEIDHDERKEYWKVTIFSTSFEGGATGTTIIIEDLTQKREFERMLEMNEARYRAVVEDQTELICRHVPGGHYNFVNEAFCRYFGVSREQVLGGRFRVRIMPDDRVAIEQYFASLTPEQPVKTIEHRIVMPDGTVRWHEWTNHAIFDEKGEIAEIQSVGRDITRRKEVESRLHEQLHFLNELIDRVPIPLFIKDIECRYLGCNKAYSDYTGQSVEYMTGKTVFEIFPDDLASEYHYHDLNVLNNQSIDQYVTRITTADGSRREIFVNKAPFYTCNGLIGGLVGVMLDITEETRTRKKYQMLYSQIPHPIMCLEKNAEDSDYRITSANTAFSDLFEIYPSDLKDKILRNIFPAINPEITGRLDHALETASVEKIVCHLQDGMPGMGLLAIPLGEKELTVFIVSDFIE